MSEQKKPGGGPGGKQGSGGKVQGKSGHQPGGAVKNRSESRESPVIFPPKPRPKR